MGNGITKRLSARDQRQFFCKYRFFLGAWSRASLCLNLHTSDFGLGFKARPWLSVNVFAHAVTNHRLQLPYCGSKYHGSVKTLGFTHVGSPANSAN